MREGRHYFSLLSSSFSIVSESLISKVLQEPHWFCQWARWLQSYQQSTVCAAFTSTLERVSFKVCYMEKESTTLSNHTPREEKKKKKDQLEQCIITRYEHQHDPEKNSRSVWSSLHDLRSVFRAQVLVFCFVTISREQQVFAVGWEVFLWCWRELRTLKIQAGGILNVSSLLFHEALSWRLYTISFF